MKAVFRFCLFLVLLLTQASCDKAERLRAEQAILLQKRAAVLDEMKHLDEQMRSLGSNGMGSVGPLNQQAADLEKEATALESTATAALKRWTALEKSVTALQERVSAWKTRNVR
jgi:chromosome segregation ATPase